MEVSGRLHAPAALPPEKSQYPLYRRLGGPQSRSGQVRKISPPRGSIHGPPSRYTDWAIPAPTLDVQEHSKWEYYQDAF